MVTVCQDDCRLQMQERISGINSFNPCRLCPRLCGVNRPAGERGFCRMGSLPSVARAAPHFWEEPCLSGTRGSGAVFFSGCTLACRYCQNWEISRGGRGTEVTPRGLAEIFRRLAGQGVHNLNLVTGTQFVPAILEALSIYRPPIPIVWNSSGYERVETLRLLEGAVDVYLPDMKYWDPKMAALLSGAGDYPQAARLAIAEMLRQTGPAVYDSEGMMRSGTHLRHLVLPGLTGDAMRILTWVKDELPGVSVSLMGQYVPCGEAGRIPGMNRRLTRREYERVAAHMRAIGLAGYRQLPQAASAAFIPAFDGTGVRRGGAGIDS